MTSLGSVLFMISYEQLQDENERLRAKVERMEKALAEIEAGYNYPRISIAEMASIARKALDGDTVN